MLNYRTNLLLTENEYQKLKLLSGKRNKTMGFLIRHAIRKTYKVIPMDITRSKVLSEIKDIARKAHINTEGINYRSLVNEGRRL